ncbi:MAG: SDR family NAD(P)-dependent oxidoreductase [Magnetospirillum sp.]
MRLDRRKVLITGAGSGIGRALAVETARRGAVVVLAGRNVAALDETAKLAGGDVRNHVVALDLAVQDERAAMFEKLHALLGGLDVLINNAGIVHAGPLSETDDETLRRLLEVDLLAPISLTRNLLPLLRASQAGQVVNVGSMFGDIAFPFFTAYSAAKFGLRGWSDALRRELADDGITVTYCAPRGTRTPAVGSYARYVAPFEMRLDAPETVANQILDAVEAGKRDVYPTGPERFFLWVQKLAPALVDGGLRKKTTLAAKNAVFRLPSGSTSILS